MDRLSDGTVMSKVDMILACMGLIRSWEKSVGWVMLSSYNMVFWLSS